MNPPQDDVMTTFIFVVMSSFLENVLRLIFGGLQSENIPSGTVVSWSSKGQLLGNYLGFLLKR